MKRCRNSPCGGVVMILAAVPFGREPGRDLAVVVAVTCDLTMYAFFGIGPDYDVRSLTAPVPGEAPRAAASFNFALQ